MTHIQSRKHPVRRAHAHLATTALGASLALALPLAHAGDTEANAAEPQAKTLDKVEVRGLRSFVVSPKFTQTLQDTPQTIEVIGKELLQEQGATTLTEALRNSAGVGTFYAGENGNTSTGDALYMRGFDSSSSIFVDGARDLGSVSRDLFNIDQVEVVKGPASTDTGRSSPTGAINMVTKQAQLREAASGSVSAGSDGQQRATADWNTTLGASSALRVNAMWQDSDVPGRDHVNNSRWGIASSLGFGLDGDTRLWLDLLYVKQDNVPDGFVPTIGLPYWEPQPGLENLAGHPVDPNNFYGTRDDHDNVTAQMATLRFEHDLSDTLKISNTLRWGETDQDYLLTAFMSTGTAANTGNIRWIDKDDLSTYTLIRSNPTFKDIHNKILTDQFNLRADFSTGAVDHFLSAGLELTREEQTSFGITATGSRPAANLYDPDWNDTGSFAWSRNGSHTHGRTDTSALYVFDTMKIGEHVLLSAGLRADHYTTEYFANAVCNTPGTTGGSGRGIVYCGSSAIGTIVTTSDLKDSDTLLSWKLGAVYKPVESLSLYANAALAQQPPGGANFQLAEGATSANGIDADPQVARTLEVGTKWAANPALTVNLALFRTTVSNEINTQDVPATQTGRKRVQGVEASVSGNITENWNVSLGYLHQKAEVDAGSLAAADGTANLAYTPSDAFTSWTTYKLPFGLTIGGGVRYTGALHRGTDGAVGTPTRTKSYTVYNAVLSYPVNERLTLRLNGYNLFDKAYVASINKSGYRYTPGTPRTFLLSADFRF
ncbi:catecholate siderophore receptor Fiu [Thermomonas brevis]